MKELSEDIKIIFDKFFVDILEQENIKHLYTTLNLDLEDDGIGFYIEFDYFSISYPKINYCTLTLKINHKIEDIFLPEQYFQQYELQILNHLRDEH